jgi:hypothetical protein
MLSAFSCIFYKARLYDFVAPFSKGVDYNVVYFSFITFCNVLCYGDGDKFLGNFTALTGSRISWVSTLNILGWVPSSETSSRISNS